MQFHHEKANIFILHDILLGYGDPSAAHYTNMPNQAETLEFKDTFINLEHIKSSFPDHQVVANDNSAELVRPFRLTFEEDEGSREKKNQLSEPYTIEKRGPYLLFVSLKNRGCYFFLF